MSKTFTHQYLPNSDQKIRKIMLDEINVKDIEQLFMDIPEEVKLKRGLNIPEALSEYQLRHFIEKILSKNVSINEISTFLGSGCYPHYVPAAVNEILNRSEFITSYTPYQPETSQGLLQVLFEYQSLICELTGMEFSNSSLYDGSTALGEAARMVKRITGRNEFLIPYYIDPEKLSVLMTYAEPAGIKVIKIKQNKENGQIDIDDLEKKLSDRTAGLYFENPSYLGCYEIEVETISELAHKHEALVIVGVDPISLGILKPPGEYGADIVVGEGQSLGNMMNFGGPLLGIFACNSNKYLRQMPGRIIGMTTSHESNERAFCMVLQTREQHIRREKATSNVCTNEALCAVAAAAYLSLLGPTGLKSLCETIITKSHYTIKKLDSIDGIKAPLINSKHFKEFTVNFDKTNLKVEEVHHLLLGKKIHGGKNIKNDFPELGETSLFCVTETHSQNDIDKLVNSLNEITR